LANPGVPSSVRDWFVPLSRGGMTLREADASLDAVRLAPEQVPFLVRLVENPALDLPFLDVFHGATDLPTHDYIHLVLGRGLLAKDEAFVIGFTMGATDQVGRGEEFLYGIFAKHFYPRQYRFGDEDLRVFRDAVRLGFISDCDPGLCSTDFERFLDTPLQGIREALGIETDLLRAYFAIEKRRFPGSRESARLLD
jgi:hypothetical protein